MVRVGVTIHGSIQYTTAQASVLIDLVAITRAWLRELQMEEGPS